MIEAIGIVKSEIIPGVTEDELLKVCKDVNDKKAPGPDDISNKIMEAPVRKISDMFIQS